VITASDLRHPRRMLARIRRHVSAYRIQRAAERQFRDIRRSQVSRCWCGGEIGPFRWHSSYGICRSCRCYVNVRPPLPEELANVYSFDRYWHERMRFKRFPTLAERVENDRADGRLARWIAAIDAHSPRRGRIVEVGCAHGVLLAEMSQRGWECLGVEIDPEVAEWTRTHTGVEVRSGIFPGIDLPQCDVFACFDVIEHAPRPDEFLRAAARLLSPGGIAVIQTPVDRHDRHRDAPPFEKLELLFDDVEHFWIFSVESMNRLADAAGLEIVAEEQGVIERDITVLRAKA
jgi:SAM-dependent methyltransferase